MQPDDIAYNLGCVVAMQSVVPAALREALATLTDRQAALRTCFLEAGADEPGAPLQHVHDSVTVPLTVVDLRHVASRAECEDRIERLAAVLVDLPFDLRRAPLLRAMLARCPGGADVVLLATHHIVSDGDSIELLARDLRACYRAALLGEPAELPELAEDFAAFARRQAELLDRERESLAAWWRDYLRGAPIEAPLPLDHDRSASPRNSGTWLPLELGGERGAGIRACAAAAGVTPFAVVLAGYAAVLGRYANVDDLLIGVPFSGRRDAVDHDVIGLYIATLPLRVTGLGDSLAALARRVHGGLAGVLDHQDYPLEALIDEHAPGRDPGVHPLFQATAVHQVRRGGGQRERGAGPGSIRFDLSLQLGEGPYELDGALGGRSELFSTATLERLRDHLHALLDAGLGQPHRPLSAVRLGQPRATPTDAAETGDAHDWQAELADLLKQRPRVRVGEEPVEFSAVDADNPADAGNPAGADNPADAGAVTLVGLDDPQSLAVALTALATGRPVTLLDAGWPEAWRARCLAEPPTGPGGLRVGEVGADGLPGLVEVSSEAVGHAIRHATEILRLTPGTSLAVGGVPPSVALLLGVLPALLAGASVTLAPGDSRALLDLIAWEGPDAALVDRSRAAELVGEGWDASTRVVSHGDPSAACGVLGPAALGHAAAVVVNARATLLSPVEVVQAGGESLAGAVGRCALGPTVSGWRARQRPDGTLTPVAPVNPSSLTAGQLEAAVRALHGVLSVSVDDSTGVVVLGCDWNGPQPAVPDWLADCRVTPGQRPWRLTRSRAGRSGDNTGADNTAADPVTAAVRLVTESCLGTRIDELDQTFFELGAHSLLIAQLAGELTDLLGVQVGLGELFRYPCVRALSGGLAGHPDPAALTGRARSVLEVIALDDAEVLRRLSAAVRA